MFWSGVLQAVAAGVVLGVGAFGYRFIDRWQKGRADVDSKDRKLLQGMRDELLGREPNMFEPNPPPGLSKRVALLEASVLRIETTVNRIDGKT